MSIENIISLLAALGVGGILGVLLNSHLEQKKQTREHELKIFRESNELLSEQQLLDLTDTLLGDHSIEPNDDRRLKRWGAFFEETGNQYLDGKLNKQNQKLHDALVDLVRFIGRNFFTIRGQNPSNTYIYLKPDFNIDRGSPTTKQETLYRELANELEELTEKAKQQYSNYRLAVKKKLKV